MARLNSGLKALINKDSDLARAYKSAGAPASRRRPAEFASLSELSSTSKYRCKLAKPFGGAWKAGFQRLRLRRFCRHPLKTFGAVG
jgi:hypothetical protein